MTAFINFAKGFKATRKTARMVLFLFAVNLLFSLLLAIPMYNSLKSSLGTSEAGIHMAKGFDIIWWEEYHDSCRGLEATFTPSLIGKGAILENLENLVQFRFLELPSSLLMMGFFYILLRTFLAGGILLTFAKEEPQFGLKRFFKGAGAYFSRFLGLTILSWVVFFAVGFLLHRGLQSLLRKTAMNSLTEVTPFYLGLLFSAAVLFVLFFVQMLFDYARIQIVVDEKRNVLKSVLNAFAFFLKHPGSTLGLYYLIFAASVADTLIYILFQGLIRQASFPGVLAAFLLQQMLIFSVVWLRCWLYSSQLELYRYWK